MATSSHPPVSASIVASVTPQSTTPTVTSSEHGSDSGNGAGATAGAASRRCHDACIREDCTHITPNSQSHKDKTSYGCLVLCVPITHLGVRYCSSEIGTQRDFHLAGGALNSAPARLALPPSSRSATQPSMPLSADNSMGMEDTMRCCPGSFSLQESLCFAETPPQPPCSTCLHAPCTHATLDK